MKVGIIGGGAAGFFTAINIAEKVPSADITILEKSGKVLSKVKVSGGGRCNVTNERKSPSELIGFYPRGGKKLYKPFEQFSTDTMRSWLQERGVDTHVEEDLRVFPKSNNSKTIIDLFTGLVQQLRIKVLKKTVTTQVAPSPEGWKITTNDGVHSFDKVVIATGSSEHSWQWLEQLGFRLEPRVPSLFTFNISDSRLHDLQGISFPNAATQVARSKLKEQGPLLITHWGISGPAVLKLSARGALELSERNYQFDVIINFIGSPFEEFRDKMRSYIDRGSKKTLRNLKVEGIPNRYLTNLLQQCHINPEKEIAQLSKKELNRLAEELTQAKFRVHGKSTFKEEFVTAGGINLDQVDLNSMESREWPGLYLAGEVLNIDALTGGFNFQACWTAGWLISEDIKNKI